jgi:hypothetical protein
VKRRCVGVVDGEEDEKRGWENIDGMDKEE